MGGQPGQSHLALILGVVAVVGLQPPQPRTFEIGIIDFYGLGQLSEGQVRQALTFTIGDQISFDDIRPSFFTDSERRLAALPGVRSASLNPVCCEAGRVIVYVGLEQQGRPGVRFRDAPKGDVRLAADIREDANALEQSFMAAVQRGDAAEDDSQGHALFHDPASRLIQQRFVGYAARDLASLRRVLHESSDADDRALAAEVIAYTPVKQDVVADLVDAMRDPSSDVRNNAMRALAMFGRMTPSSDRPAVQVPSAPFIDLINSPVWTDRNKSSLALMELTEPRDPKLLAQLRERALPSLVEMARWKSEGHATPALLILGRIAGLTDEAVDAAVKSDDRERIIRAATARR
jgi:hypothetical protein